MKTNGLRQKTLALALIASMTTPHVYAQSTAPQQTTAEAGEQAVDDSMIQELIQQLNEEVNSGLMEKIKAQINLKYQNFLNELVTVKINGEEKRMTRGEAEAQKSVVSMDLSDIAKEQENSSDDPSWLEKNFNKLKVSIPLSKTIHISKKFKVKVTGLERRVEPTNIAGQQRLSDIVMLRFATRNGVLLEVGARATFARLVDGPNAKWDAIKSPIYYLGDIPRSGSEVMKKIKPDETVRLEFEGAVGLQKNIDKFRNKVDTNVTIGYEKRGLFLIDIHREKKTDNILTRFLGMKNRGTFKADLDISKSLFSRALPGRLGDLFSVGLDFSFTSSDSLFTSRPIDTMMAVYRFNMEKPDSIGALDEIADNIKKLRFVKPFIVFSEEQNLAKELLRQASLAEQYAREDMNLATRDRRVQHEFRGRLITTITCIKPGFHLSAFVGGSDSGCNSQTFVRKYKTMDEMDFYMSEHAKRTTKLSRMFGQRDEKKIIEAEMLVKSDKDKNLGEVMDLIKKTETQKAKFDRDDLQDLQVGLRRTIPLALASNEEVAATLPNERQDSGTFAVEVKFGAPAIQYLANFSPNHLAVKYMDFLQTYPGGFSIVQEDHPTKVTNPGGQTFGEYTESTGYNIEKMFNSPDRKERMMAFRNLNKDGIFQHWAMDQFLPSLLPAKDVEAMLGVSTQFSSNKIQNQKPKSFGKVESSSILKAVRFMRRVLEEDRGMDLHLDELGKSAETK